MSHLPGVLVRAVLLLVAALLPAAMPAALPAHPDLVLLVVLAAGLVHGPATGALVGLAGGWLVDLAPPSGEPLGGAALSYLAAGGLAGLARRFTGWSPLLPLGATAALALLVHGIPVVAAAAGVGVVDLGEQLWAVLLTTLVATVLVPLLMAVEHRLTARGWA